MDGQDRGPGSAGAGLSLGSLAGLVGYALRRAQLLVFADFHKHFAALGLRPATFSVLLVLRENPGARPSQVAAALGIQRANFVALLAGLEAEALIERRAAPGDRRAVALHLTDEGKTLLRQADRTARAHEAKWRRRLGEDGYEQLLALLGRLEG